MKFSVSSHPRFTPKSVQERLDWLLRSGSCHCTRGCCFQRLRALQAELVEFVSSFRSLPKVEQDAFAARLLYD